MAKSSSSSRKNEKGAAIGKRIKIDNAQRNMLLIVCVASIVLGVTVVLIAYFARIITFNRRLIEVKNIAISAYKSTQSSLDEVSSGIVKLSGNEYLESVARTRNDTCKSFDEQLRLEEKDDGPKTNFGSDEINRARECTALRVITDALPSTENIETTMTSFIYLLDRSESVGGAGLTIEGSGYEEGVGVKQIGDVSLNTFQLSVAFSSPLGMAPIMSAVRSLDSSIRVFDISSVSIEAGDEGNVELSTSYNAYYSTESTLKKVNHTVCANEGNEKCKAKGGHNSVSEEGNSTNGESNS